MKAILKPITVVVVLGAFLGGCAGSGSSYVPVVDGTQSHAFDRDLLACQQVAKQLKFNNGDVRSNAALGAGVGAVIGAVDSGIEGAIVGAVLGGALEGGGRAWEVRDERKGIVINCMAGRGHNIVG